MSDLRDDPTLRTDAVKVLYEIVMDVCASLVVLSLMVIGLIETVHWLKGF